MLKYYVIAVLCLAAILASVSLVMAGESGYANVVTVSATGADFTSVASAVNSITDASDTNRYCVKVYPGTYSGRVECKPYVDIIGVSKNSVILTHNGTAGTWPPTNPATLQVCGHMCAENMTVKATAVSGVAVQGGGPDCELNNLNVIAETMGVDIGAGSVTSEMPGRESSIDQYATIRDSKIKAKVTPARLGDFSATYGCTFTIDTEGGSDAITGIYVMGNAIIRDCQVNLSVSGTSPSEICGIRNDDAATPTRIERTSVHVQVYNSSASFPVYGVLTGVMDDHAGATTDIDQCSIGITNLGSGSTYDIANAWNETEYHDTTNVFATKYNTSRTYGTITIADGN